MEQRQGVMKEALEISLYRDLPTELVRWKELTGYFDLEGRAIKDEEENRDLPDGTSRLGSFNLDGNC